MHRGITPVARKILKSFDAEHYADNLSSIVLIEHHNHGKSYIYTESSAALRILLQLDQPLPVFYSLIAIPRYFQYKVALTRSIIRDSVYQLVGQNRYNMFGKEEKCIAPPAEHAHKFLS
jgi:predicted DCC family thiol-disulfide oxidoreductase YuxK